jgi:hypothetical protein
MAAEKSRLIDVQGWLLSQGTYGAYHRSSRLGAQFASDQFEQAGFPGAVLADQTDILVVADLPTEL